MDVVAAGHEVALHGVDHQRLTTLSSQEVQERLVRGKAVLEEVSGTGVRWFRSPYGAQNVGTYRAIRRAGLHSVVWTAAGEDWVAQDPSDVAPRLMESLKGGGIVLLHDALAGDPRRARGAGPARASARRDHHVRPGRPGERAASRVRASAASSRQVRRTARRGSGPERVS